MAKKLSHAGPGLAMPFGTPSAADGGKYTTSVVNTCFQKNVKKSILDFEEQHTHLLFLHARLGVNIGEAALLLELKAAHGQTKVGQLQMPALRDQEIVGLQISAKEAQSSESVFKLQTKENTKHNHQDEFSNYKQLAHPNKREHSFQIPKTKREN